MISIETQRMTVTRIAMTSSDVVLTVPKRQGEKKYLVRSFSVTVKEYDEKDSKPSVFIETSGTDRFTKNGVPKGSAVVSTSMATFDEQCFVLAVLKKSGKVSEEMLASVFDSVVLYNADDRGDEAIHRTSIRIQDVMEIVRDGVDEFLAGVESVE